MTAVPFLELAAQHAELAGELADAYRRVLASGRFILGAELEQFETEFAAYCGARHCVGVSNGLDALHLILRAAGIGPGDEVLVPSNTFVATWLAVSYAGAVPVPVEPDPATYNITAAGTLAALSPRTRGIIAVHLYGQTADMNSLQQVAAAHGLLLIEDAAQAHGARLHGQRAGSLGEAAAFSFYPGKNLGALGDGGAVVTSNGQLADRVRRLRNYGSDRKYHHEVAGFNARLDELQAAFLRAKLPRLEAWNARRREVAARYAESLASTGLGLPQAAPGCDPAWHLFVVRCVERDRLQAELGARGVETQVHYPVPPHRSGAYRERFAQASLPLAERLAGEVLSLPMGPAVSDAQIARVAQAAQDGLSAMRHAPAGAILRSG